MFRKKNPQIAGFTLMEMLVSITIGSLVVVALSLFFARGIAVNRYDYEQILITEDTRLQLTRVTDVVRNAVNDGSGWLKTAGDNSLQIYVAPTCVGNNNNNSNSQNSNSDSAGCSGNNTLGNTIREVQYSLNGTNFIQTKVKNNGGTVITTLARSVQNTAQGVNIFTYYDINGQAIPSASATTSNVKRIGITLAVDTNPNQKPDASIVKTFVVPRSALNSANVSARLWAVTIRYPSNPANNSMAEVQTFNPDTNKIGKVIWSVATINNGKLSTYGGDYVNINYQAQNGNGNSTTAGWYAWVGPIWMGGSGDQKYFATDQVPITSLCLNQDLPVLVATCPLREFTAGGFTVKYQPIIMYSDFGFKDYVKTLLFNYTGT